MLASLHCTLMKKRIVSVYLSVNICMYLRERACVSMCVYSVCIKTSQRKRFSIRFSVSVLIYGFNNLFHIDLCRIFKCDISRISICDIRRIFIC